LSLRVEGNNNAVFLADTDLFFFYFKGGKLSNEARQIVMSANSGHLELRTSSEVYDDAISVLRSGEVELNIIHDFVSKMKSIPHKSLPMSAEIAEEALSMYRKYGGRSRLSYFDSFHAATAKRFALPLLTSDGYLRRHAKDLEISVTDLSSIEIEEKNMHD
jgi:predicted nucleic acid-binding protein